MNKKYQIRQGDVLLEEVSEIPSKAIKQKVKDRIYIAYGDVTGHHHSIDINDADYWKEGESQYIKVKKETNIVHQTHRSIPLEKKIFKRIPQVEYTPQEIRTVAD